MGRETFFRPFYPRLVMFCGSERLVKMGAGGVHVRHYLVKVVVDYFGGVALDFDVAGFGGPAGGQVGGGYGCVESFGQVAGAEAGEGHAVGVI